MNEDKAARYHRLKRRASVVSFACGVALLVGLALTGVSIAMRQVTGRLVGDLHGSGLALVGSRSVYLVFLGLLSQALSLPFTFYSGYFLEHRYGLATETIGRWAVDRLKALALTAVVGLVGANLVYAAIDAWPRDWWIAAGAGFTAFGILVALVFPILLLPIFYRISPLGREDLRQRLVALAGRAGVRVVDAYEMTFSDRTRKANAALTGLGRTRRILISDTLLAEYSDDEIESVLAHELGHHVHHDIWTGIALEAVLGFAGFYLASRVLLQVAAMAGLTGPSDIAGLPVLLLAAGALSFALVPAVNALSRHQERRADRYGLEAAGNAGAFISAMRRLASQNLAEEHPSSLVRLLFYTHPPVSERIEFARRYTT